MVIQRVRPFVGCFIPTVLSVILGPAIAANDPKIETICRGVERRPGVLATYTARVVGKAFIPSRTLAIHKLAAGSWGDPKSLGFHPDELTDRSLTFMSVCRTPSLWWLETLCPVFDGVNVWELYKLGGTGERGTGFSYHTLTAGDGRQVARWTDCRNMVVLEPYDLQLTGDMNHLETKVIQTGLFHYDFLRSAPEGPQLRVVGTDTLAGCRCVVIQRKATRATRPENPNQYTRIWVAPERSYAILRWEGIRLVEGHDGEEQLSRALGIRTGLALRPELTYAYAASDLREVVPGFWVPWRTVDQAAYPGEDGRTQDWHIRQLEVNTLVAGGTQVSVLDLMPLGAQVNDFFEKRGYPNGWEQGEIEKFLTEPRPEPEQIRPLPTLTGEHTPTEP